MTTNGVSAFKHLTPAPWQTAIATAVSLWVMAAPLHAEANGPFGGLAGTWSGSGVIKTKEGGQERIRCRGVYEVQGGGTHLVQALRCASDSFQFEMSTSMSQMGDHLSGSWSENTRHVQGRITGHATATTIRARADGDSFTALLSV